MNNRVRISPEARKVFGKKLLDAIRNSNMNQSDFARRIDVTKDAVSSWCRGRCIPRPATLTKVCSELGIEPEHLIRRRYDTSTYNPTFSVVSTDDDTGKCILSMKAIMTLDEAAAIIKLVPNKLEVCDEKVWPLS